MEKLTVNLTAGRQPEGHFCDKSSHGYAVYYNGENQIVKAFLRSACAWGGPSNMYKTQKGEEFKYYEFSYEDYDLFLLPAIKRFLHQNDVELTVAETQEDMRKFWGFE